MVSEGKENEAFRFLAKNLFSMVSVREHVQYTPSMTNNEFLSKLPSPETIRPFTILYEKMVYSGKATTDDKEQLYEIFNDIIDRYLSAETYVEAGTDLSAESGVEAGRHKETEP